MLSQEQAAARNAAEQAEAALGRYTADAQRKGLAAYEQAAEIRSTVVAARKAAEEARSGLSDALSDPVLPVAWLSSLWSRYVQAWDSDQRARHAKLLAQEFKKRDQRIIAALPKGMAKGTVEVLRQALDADLKTFAKVRGSNGPRLYDAPPKDVEQHLKDARIRVKRQLDHLQSAQLRLDKSEQRIGQIPAEEQIADILDELQEKSKLASSAAAKFAAVTQQLQEAQSNLEHVSLRLNAARDRIGSEFRDRSMEAKSLEASARARKALSLFKGRLLASKAQWLSSMITSEFRRLLRKRNLMASVVVDPDTYQVSIRDGKQQELPMDRLSAGERQLLATSVASVCA
ncbi:hypothetical protein [Burkholderia pseudomallei]|uniref:hypothetical protein n=1 Tax=Burkholderia pseudomallei TaxID=28450 RepID=UPI000ABA9804|nr:hypothetical protein [Burkholderia pseudomallei]